VPDCPNCASLIGAPSCVPPHETLVYLGLTDYQPDAACLERYRCTVCGAVWIRDPRKIDPAAIWEEQPPSSPIETASADRARRWPGGSRK
jgi:hypothetical protein